jgi:glycosyltransferase involved in cell wall biosynthesis
MEAMSQELPVVATRAGAIDEVVVPERTGLLVQPDDPVALTAALAELICAPERRTAMGREGRRRILGEFAFTDGIARLAARFGLAIDRRSAA